MSCQGSVKSFNQGKGYGFINYNDQDVFLHIRDCEGEGAPAAGDVVTFEVEESPSKPGTYVARKVNGGTAPREKPSDGMKGGGKGTRAPAQGTGALHGLVKSYNATKAWGFIVYEGQDIFFHLKDMVDGSAPNAGDAVQFDTEDNPAKPGSMKARNITGGTGYPQPKGMDKGMDKGMEKGMDMGKGYGKGKDMWGGCGGGGYGADPWGGCGGYGMGPYGGGKGMDPWAGKGGCMDPWGGKGGGWGMDPWGGKGGGMDPWGGKGGGMMMGGKGKW